MASTARAEERLTVHLTVNGQPLEETVDARLLLVHFIRDVLELTGTHVGCDTTSCGACAVLLDGRAVKSCTVFAVQADGRDIVTIEGLEQNGAPHPVQAAFFEKHAMDCGYCTPGMVISGYSLLQRNGDPTEDEIREAISGNLCRCTGYANIVDAIRTAAEHQRNGGTV
ncbi:MAG: carbon monoxide dehydrogenase [Chloroflexi bacterium]|nr:carbon monoxide dehydrogenase [Chloroflexota bacterium]